MAYGIVALVSAISSDVTTALAASGYPPLTDGSILLGRQHQYEQSAPPRIIMTPVKSRFRARDSSSVSWLMPSPPGGDPNPGVGLRAVLMTQLGSGYTHCTVAFTGGGGVGATGTCILVNGSVSSVRLVTPGQGYTSQPTPVFTGDGTGAAATSYLLPLGEYRAEAAQKSLLTEDIVFECRCWATVPAQQNSTSPTPDDPDTDFDFTQALYQQVVRSCHHIAVGSFEVIGEGGGVWTDSKLASSQFFRNGREFVFSLSLSVPVLDQLLPYAPTGTYGQFAVQMLDPSGSGDVINEVDISTS